jgi:hypothetical protein
MRKLAIMIIVSIMACGCDLVDLDPTNAAMIDMRNDIDEMNENGIRLRTN